MARMATVEGSEASITGNQSQPVIKKDHVATYRSGLQVADSSSIVNCACGKTVTKKSIIMRPKSLLL